MQKISRRMVVEKEIDLTKNELKNEVGNFINILKELNYKPLLISLVVLFFLVVAFATKGAMVGSQEAATEKNSIVLANGPAHNPNWSK